MVVMFVLRARSTTAIPVLVLLLVAHFCLSSALEAPGSPIDSSPKGYFGRKLHGWECSCSKCGTYSITRWDKNCRCCYVSPPERSSCLMYVCPNDTHLYFKNSCQKDLVLRWLNKGTGNTRTRTAVYRQPSGEKPLRFEGKVISIDPRDGPFYMAYRWAGEGESEWKSVNMETYLHPCTGEDCDSCCNKQAGYKASFTC